MGICELCCLKKKKLSTLPCQHSLCRKCKSTWLRINPTCPFCRSDVPKKYDSKYFDMYIREDLILLGQFKKRVKVQMNEMFRIENIITNLLDAWDVSDDIDISYLISVPNCLENYMPMYLIEEIQKKYITVFNDLLFEINATDDSIFYMDELISNTKRALLERFSDKIDESSKSITRYLMYTRNENINPYLSS